MNNRKFQNGEKVKIVENRGYGFEVGTIVTIKYQDLDGMYRIVNSKGEETWARERRLEKIEQQPVFEGETLTIGQVVDVLTPNEVAIKVIESVNHVYPIGFTGVSKGVHIDTDNILKSLGNNEPVMMSYSEDSISAKFIIISRGLYNAIVGGIR